MITYLDVQHLNKRIGDLVLLDDVAFSIGEGHRVGLIARNGAGKTTLLNILSGKEDYESGSVVYRNDIKVGYLEQSPEFDPTLSVIDACFAQAGELSDLIARYEKCLQTEGTPGIDALIEEMERREAWDFELRAKQILSRLNITDFSQPIGQLSGGQIKRVALANVLLSNPDLLILDEPTNHLDLEMIEWLESYLRREVKALFMVTHDRYFLDRVCSEILELDQQKIFSYKGNYAYYLEKRAERVAAEASSVQKAQNLYRTELDWMRRMPQARGGKAKYRKDAFYELEKLAKQRLEEKAVRLQVKTEYLGSKIIEAQYVSKTFQSESRGDKVILKDFYYNFTRFEKIGIVGGNGTGKSTFIKMILDEVRPDSGRFVVGETIRFGYYSQNGMEFDNQMKVIDAVRNIAETVDLGGGRRITAMQFLSHFQFPPARQQDYIYKLSGGERRRLYLCTVLMQNPNFLILDEPTNDLDISTLQVLEEYLADFRGCVLVVSHDRYFMDKVVDHLFVFKGEGDIKDFPGNYTQFRAWEALQEEEEKAQPKAKVELAKKENTYTSERKRKLTFKEKQEMEALEADIAKLEAEKAEIETALSSGTLSVEEITAHSRRLPLLTEELEEKEMRWLELSEI
ncbi:MAG: ABC-F family ATP-binding cassette domain-containing protein [Bacteroidales bacterium]|nr:ABC-F family ATP-binding cassette domain-containing protein [Bacteroidales bacterium]